MPRFTIDLICHKLEGYNGWGYRPRKINSRYLWSYSNHYTSGKYVADGIWSPTAVFRQCASAAILRHLSEQRAIDLASPPSAQVSLVSELPHVAYSVARPTDLREFEKAQDLQRLLNGVPRYLAKGGRYRRTADIRCLQKDNGKIPARRSSRSMMGFASI
jgi:hypothetical protein